MRVPIYFKNKEFIRAADGDKCPAIFFGPYDHSEEPYIRIALGDYEKITKKWGERPCHCEYFVRHTARTNSLFSMGK